MSQPSVFGRRSILVLVVAMLAPLVAGVPAAGAPIAELADTWYGTDTNGKLGQAIASDGVHHVIGATNTALAVQHVGSWGPTTPLVVPGGTPSSFGSKVALDISADGQYGIAVVGAPLDGQVAIRGGSAHVFEYSPLGGWTFVETMSGSLADEQVGSSVEVQILDDDRTANVLVGAQQVGGVGYVASWIRQNGTSSAVEIATATLGGDVDDRFGQSMAADGDTMVVGSPLDLDGGSNKIWAGTATVFSSDPGGAIAGGATMGWVEQANLSLCGVAPVGEPHAPCGTSTGEQFGYSVAIDADVIAVGAWLRSAPGGGDAGSVTAFRRAGLDWEREAHLYHNAAQPTDRLGTRVAVQDRLIMATAVGQSAFSGALQPFVFDGVQWINTEAIVAEGPGTEAGQLGLGLSLDGTSLIAGAPLQDTIVESTTIVDAGAVFALDVEVPPADYPPLTQPDNYATWPSDAATFDVLTNDVDPEGNALTLIGVRNGPNHGTVNLVGGTEINYTPAAGFKGVDTFEYNVSDGRRDVWETINVTVGSEIRIDDISVDESVSAAEVSVVVDPPSDLGVTFTATYADGTATTPGDYTPGLAVFAVEPGAFGTTVSVPIVGDNIVEPTETFTVSIADVIGAQLVDAEATVTIFDEDVAAPVSATIRQVGGATGAVEVNEPDGTVDFEIVLSEGLDVETSVDFATREQLDGPIPAATVGEDFTDASGTATFQPGDTVVQFGVPISDNGFFEDREAFEIALTSTSPVDRLSLAQPSLLVVTIIDDEDNIEPPGPGEGDPPTPPDAPDYDPRPSVQSVCQTLLSGLDSLDPTAWFNGLDIDALPALPDASSDFPDLFDAIRLDLPNCVGFTTWEEFVDWLISLLTPENPPSTPAADSAAPNARPDEVTMRQGTTVFVDVMANDHDPAARHLSTAMTGSLPNGLTAVDVDPSGLTTITAAADFVGSAQFFYKLCPVDASCATGSVLVTVIDGPVPPRPFPDHVTLDNSEILTYRDVTFKVAEWGPNVLFNDAGPNLELRSVTSAPFIDVSHRADGQVRLEHIDQPGFEIDGPPDDIELSYEVCTPEEACATSTLTVHYMGEFGPDTAPDFANANRLGTVVVRPLFNDPVNPGGVVVAEAFAAPESVGSTLLIDVRPDNTIEITMAENPDPETHVLHKVCPVVEGAPDLAHCTTELITIYLVDRIGPVAHDDNFTLPVAAAWRPVTSDGGDAIALDVLGEGGGGADEFWGRHGSITEPALSESTVVYAESLTGERKPFAVVVNIDNVLVLTPPSNEVFDLPGPGWSVEFEYDICDFDIDTGTGTTTTGLCDTGSVFIDLIEEPPAEIEPERYVVGVWSTDDPNTWEIPFGYVPVTPSAQVSALETGAINYIFELRASVDPEFGTITGSPSDADVDIRFYPSNPQPKQQVEIHQVVENPYNSGEVTSKVYFARNELRALPAAVEVSSEGVDVDLADYAVPSPYAEVPVSVTMLSGQEAVGAEIEESFYRITGTTAENPTTIRIEANPGIGGISRALTYTICADFEAPRGEVGTELLQQTECHDAFLMLHFDTTSDSTLGNGLRAPGSFAQFPFDTATDTYLEFRLDEDLPETRIDGATGLGPIDGVVGGLDDLLRTSGVELSGSATLSGSWSALVGVDPDGLYIGGESLLTLELAGVGVGSFEPGPEDPNVTVSATAAGLATITVKLGDDGERLRLTDLTAGLDLQIDYDGIVGVRADASIGGVVTAQPYAITTFSSSPSGISFDSTTVDVPVQITLPGVADDNGDPVVINMRGTVDNGQLTITGAANLPPGSVIDGFGVRDATVDLTVTGAPTNTTVNGTISAIVDVELIGASVPIDIVIDGTNVSATAFYDLAGTSLGPVDAPFLTIDEGTLTVVISGNAATNSASASVGLAAETVRVLPDNPAGSATLTGVNGSITTSGGAQVLSFGSLTTGTDTFTAISTGAGTLTLGDPSLPLLALNNVTALDAGGVSVTIVRLEFYDDGRVLVLDGCLAADAGLAEAIGIAGILPFDVTSACLNGNEIIVNGYFDFTMMEDLPFTPSISIGDRLVNQFSDPTLETNQFVFVFDATTLKPIDLGPITVGITDLEAAGVNAAGEFTIAGYSSGDFDGTFAGEVDIDAATTSDGLPLGGTLDVAIDGEITFDLDGTATFNLEAAIGATGFIGDYVELTSGDLELATTISVAPDLAIDVTGPGLTSAELAGIVRVPGLESSADAANPERGGIPVTITYGTTADGWELTANAAGGGTYTAGGQTFTDVTGELRVSRHTNGVVANGVLTATSLSGSIADIVAYSTGDARLTFDGSDATPLLAVNNVTATLPDPDAPTGPPLASLTIDFIEISDDGTLSSGVITATDLDRLADQFGFGGLFPFTVTGLRIDPTDLADIRVTVAGEFDFSDVEAALAPATFSATIGDTADSCGDLGITGGVDTFCFTIAVDALTGGGIAPIDFGPVEVTVSNLDVAGVVGNAGLRIEGYSDGTFDRNFSGSVDVATDFDGALDADFSAPFVGQVADDGDGGVTMSIVATVDGSASVGGVSGSVTATFDLTIAVDAVGNVTVTGPRIESAEVVVCLELPGFASTSGDYGECDGVFASISVDGNVWSATIISDADLGTTTNGLTIEGLTGSLSVDASDPDNLVVSGQLGADRVDGVLGGLIEVEVVGSSADPINFNFDTDPDTNLLDSVDVTGRLLGSDGTTLAALGVNGFSIASDGTIDIDEIRLTELDALTDELGVADVLPFGVSGIAVQIVGDVLTQPESFVIRAAGTFDLSAISQYDPIVQIGGVTPPGGVTGDCDGLEVDAADLPAYGGTFCFALAIDESGIRPHDLGPITLGLRRVEMGPITMGGELELGGYQNGAFVPTLDGYLEVTGETTLHDAAVGATGRVDISAAFGVDGDAITLDLTALLTASLQISDLLIVEEATVGFGLGLRWDPPTGLTITGAEVNAVGAAAVQVSAGGIVTFRMTNIEFPLDGVTFVRFGPPEDFDPAVHGDGEPGVASLTFGGVGEAGVEGWGGSVRNFEIGMDGGIDMLPGFGITATGASAKSLGLDEWIPISVTEAGIVFNDSTPDDLIADIVDRKRLDLDQLTDVTLIVSAELTDSDVFPVQGAVEGLEVNVRYLREWTEALLANEVPDFTKFPVTNLDAVFFGVSNVELGPVTFSGGLGFGMVPTDQGPKFWGRILAGGTFDGFGLSIDMTVTERGPISLKVEVPAAVVLGQTTIVLAVQEIAVAFNKEIPSICTTFEQGEFVCTVEDPDGGVTLDDEGANGPLALVNDPAFGSAHLDTVEQIRTAVENQFALNDDGSVPPFDAIESILPDQFALSVKGSITSLALAGQLSGNVELVISFDKPTEELPLPGVRIIGTGTLNVYGMGVGEVKIYLDYSDPLAPAITLAAALPAESGLLDLLVPGTVQFGITVDSQGMYAAPILAMREMIVRTLQSTATNPEVQEIIEPLIADLAARLEANRDSELAMIILDVDRDGVIADVEDVPIDVGYLTQRVAEMLPNTEVPSDGSAGDSELLFGQTRDDLILASEFATALFMDLLNGSTDLSSIDLPEGTTFDDVLAAMISVFQDVLTQAPDIAQVFYDVINPSIIMQGLVQYELFDIPLGEPAQEALIVIDKNEVYAEFTQSLKATSQMAMVVCTPCLAVSAALTAGLDDRTTMRFSLPFPIQELIDGEGIGTLDPFSGGWSMSIGSQLFVFGFEAGTVDGLIVPADSSEQITRWLATLPDDRAAALAVPDALAADGGVYASGRLQLPELLADPLGWIVDAQAAYDGLDDVELLQLPTYLSENAETLLATREAGSFEMFLPLPTPQALSDAGIDVTDGVTPDELEGTALDLLDDLYVRADLGLDLFGYRMTSADFSLTEEGMEGSITFPFFGAPLTAVVNNTTYTIEDEVTGATEQVTWPAVMVDEDVSIEEVRNFLEPYGFDSYIPDAVDNSVRFRAYSPSYHLSQPNPDAYAQTNPLSVNGGVELVITSDIAGVLQGGDLVVSVGFGVGGSLLPSSIDAALSFGELDLGGVTITDALVQFEYRHDGTTVSSDITVSGTIDVLDTKFTVSGSLSSGRLEATSERPTTIAGLTATRLNDPNRGPVVAVLYDDATDTAAIEVKGRLYVSGWSGYATIDALLGSGDDAVTISLVGLRRAGVSLGGTMSLVTRPAGFTLTASNTTVTVPGLLGPVTVNAVITEQGVQSMSINDLAFQFAPGIGFECADIDFVLKGGEFRLSGSANVTIIGLAELVDPKGSTRGKPGSLPIGCESNGMSAAFDLATSGYGSIGLQVDDVTLGLVTVSDVDVSVTRGSGGVFANLDGTVTFLGATMTLDGSMAITSSGLDGDIALSGSIPDLYGWQLTGRIGLDAEPGRATRFSVDGSVRPPGTNGVDVEGWVTTTGSFSLNVTSSSVTFGSGSAALTVSGAMTLSRASKSTMRLRLTNGSMAVGPIGTVSVDELVVASSGTFSVTNLSLPEFGNSNLKLLGAQIDAERTGTGAITITLRGGGVTGRFLNGETVSLGTNKMTATLDPNMAFERNLTVTDGLDLGPALQTSKIRFTFSLGADGLDLTQRFDVNVSTLAGSATMSIKDFDLHVGRTGGATIGGRVKGKLTIAGRTLTNGTYSISNSGNNLRLSLITTETIKLGALGQYSLLNSASRPAWFKSDGTFNFTLYVNFVAPGPGPLKATGDLTIGRNSSGLYTAFEGTGCGFFPTYGCASAEGTLSTTNVLTLTVTHPDYGSITLWLPPI